MSHAEILTRLQLGLIGGYEVERELGHGGMAVVFLAEDTRHRRRVALKVLRPELEKSVDADRFLREIQTVGQLVHPNILPLYDSGQVDGLLYYVMPYVEGESLAERLERTGPMDVDEAVAMVTQLADALHYAHQLGIVHRDVKPANILVSAGRHVSLADFGLASACNVADTRRLTLSGVVLGSPLYMSPEQISGGQPLDGRADVYSLGCMLFEMLVGRTPFAGRTVQSVLHGHLLNPPPALVRLRPDTPPPIAALVRQAMEKSPDNRPTADAFRAVLQSWLRGDATSHAAPTEVPDELAESGDASRWGFERSGVDITMAVLPFRSISAQPEYGYLADAITEELITTLGQLEGIRVAARSSVYAFRETTLRMAEVGERLDVGAVLEGSVRQAGRRLKVSVQLVSANDGFQLWSASFDGALDDVFALQEGIARDVATALLGKLGRGSKRRLGQRATDESEAYNLYLLGRHHWHGRTPEGLSRAVESFSRACELDPGYARAYAGKGDAYLAMGQFMYRPPHEVMPLAEEAVRRALELDPANAEAQATLGHILDSYYHDWSGAEQAYRRAIRLDPRYASARLWLGDLLTALGRFEEALELGASSLELEPFAVANHFGYGAQLYRARRFPEALEAFRRTLEMEPRYFSAWTFLAFTHAAAGEPRRGVQLALQAMERLDPLPPFILTILGFCQALAGDAADARATLARIETLRGKAFLPAVSTLIIHGALGESDRAFELMHRAVDERYGQFIFVAVDPAFDSIRGDGRFGQVLGRMGLEGVNPTAPSATTRKKSSIAVAGLTRPTSTFSRLPEGRS